MMLLDSARKSVFFQLDIIPVKQSEAILTAIFFGGYYHENFICRAEC